MGLNPTSISNPAANVPPRTQQMMAQGPGSLSPMWKILIEFIYKSEFQRERQTEASSMHLFNFQVVALNRNEPGWSLEPEAPFGSPTWMARTHVLEPSSVAFSRPLTGSWISSWGTRTWTGVLRRCWCCKWQLCMLCHNANPCIQFLTPAFPLFSPACCGNFGIKSVDERLSLFFSLLFK